MYWPIRFKVGKCEKDIQLNWQMGGGITQEMYKRDGWIWSANRNGPFGRNWWRWGN